MNTDYNPDLRNDTATSPSAAGLSGATGGAGLAGQTDDALLFDILETPGAWPNDPAKQAELAELLEIHLAMGAHADDLASGLSPSKGIKRFATRWLLPIAAALIAILPSIQVVSRVRETRRMQARGAALETKLQKRLQAELWSDFFSDSLDLIKQVQAPAQFCGPRREDRSVEVEQARRLYALGRSLPLDGLDDPEVVDTGKNLQNWLTEVSASDGCISFRRSHELLELAMEMDLEDRAAKLNRKLREVYS